MKVFPDVSAKYDTTVMNFCKITLVTALGLFLNNLTRIPGTKNNVIPTGIAYLILGLVFTMINVLPKNALKRQAVMAL